MASAKSMEVALKTLLIVLFCVMIAAYVYVFAIGGVTSCFDWSTRWDLALLMDFSIYAATLAAWCYYKESSWIKGVGFFVSMQIVGSVATIPYIFFQFYKLSPEESAKDPLYFVLARRHKREHTKETSVVTARVFFCALGCFMLGLIIYTIIKDISGSFGEPFSACFLTYVVDIYTLIVVLSVWIAYKESSWISASLWILSLVCLGGIPLCVYILLQLLYVPTEQPASLIIFSNSDRDLQSKDPLLVPHAIV